VKTEQRGSFDELISAIKIVGHDRKCRIIAISGFGGAGKSTLARTLAISIGEAEVVCVDEFIVNRLENNPHRWEGIDWRRLEREVLAPVELNQEWIEYGIYDWAENCVANHRRFPLPRFLIVEGVGLLRPDLMQYFDLTVWLDVPMETATARGMKRDREEYHIDADDSWINSWSVNDREYFEKYRPMEITNFILRVEQQS
jgi:uridine kinase